jgi:hypothetical protein
MFIDRQVRPAGATNKQKATPNPAWLFKLSVEN